MINLDCHKIWQIPCHFFLISGPNLGCCHWWEFVYSYDIILWRWCHSECNSIIEQQHLLWVSNLWGVFITQSFLTAAFSGKIDGFFRSVPVHHGTEDSLWTESHVPQETFPSLMLRKNSTKPNQNSLQLKVFNAMRTKTYGMSTRNMKVISSLSYPSLCPVVGGLYSGQSP